MASRFCRSASIKMVLTVCATLLLGGADRSFAQEDEVPLDLIGTWRVDVINGAATNAQIETSLEIEEAGTVGGSGGCNSLFGPLRFSDNGVRIGPLAVSRKACQPDILKQEQDFLKAVATVRGFSKQESSQTLLLQNAAGEEVMRLTADN